MPPVRLGRVATRSRTVTVQMRSRGGRTRGSNQGSAVVDGDANINVGVNDDPPVLANNAGQEGAPVTTLDPKNFEELIASSIAKGVEIGVDKALAILEPGQSATSHLGADGSTLSTSSAPGALA